MDSFQALGDDIGASISIIVPHALPGERVNLHRHPYAEVFVVLAGEVTFTLGDEQRIYGRARSQSLPRGSRTAW